MHQLKSLIMACVLILVTTIAANAQTRSIYTGGNSTNGGTVKITIEDFDKPGRHDLITPQSTSSPAALFEVNVVVAPGWTCAQTTTAIFNEMVATLPPIYLLQIAPTNPCIIWITRDQEGSVVWNINIEIEVEGQTIIVEEGAVPVQSMPWSRIKSLGWNRFHS